MLGTFADQAVIAIQNARLFNETKEALERQTASAEILRVLSGSPSAVKPVFDAITASAYRLLGCAYAVVLMRDGDGMKLVSLHRDDRSVEVSADTQFGRRSTPATTSRPAYCSAAARCIFPTGRRSTCRRINARCRPT